MNDSWFLIALILAWAFDLVLTVARFSLENLNLSQLADLEKVGPQAVQRAHGILQQKKRVLTALRFTQMTFSLLVFGCSLIVFQPLSWGWTLGLLVVTGWLLTLSETIVEALALPSLELWALRLTPLAAVFHRIFGPLLAVPFIRSRYSPKMPREELLEAELKSLVTEGQQEGVLEQDEQEMIISIFQFRNTLAREVMVPRIDMLALDVNTSLTEAVDALLESGYSRVPVYEGKIDDIQGLLYAKDLLRAWREGRLDNLRQLLRPAYFVPEAKKVDELLAEMQEKHFHMAIVVDEYGGVAGLVTLEDIVEEIVGEIQDEYDLREEQVYQQVSDDEYLFLGRIDLDDVNHILQSHLPVTEADTLGGFLYSRIGKVPIGGEQVVVDNILLTVEQVTGRRIRKVRANVLPLDTDIVEEANHAD